MHDAGCLGLVHWDDPEGWYGEGGGRRVQDGEKKKKKKLDMEQKTGSKLRKEYKKKKRFLDENWSYLQLQIPVISPVLLRVLNGTLFS